MTCAKGITSGYLPLGACLISDRVFSQISGAKANKAVFTSNAFRMRVVGRGPQRNVKSCPNR